MSSNNLEADARLDLTCARTAAAVVSSPPHPPFFFAVCNKECIVAVKLLDMKRIETEIAITILQYPGPKSTPSGDEGPKYGGDREASNQL